MKNFKWLVVLFLGMFSATAFSQVSASFYMNEGNSKVAIGYEFNEKLWADARLFSRTNLDNITPELVLNYNFMRKENYYTYVGGGVILNTQNGIVVPVGIGIMPFENLKNFSINLEFTPFYEIDDNDLYLSGFIGIRYKLN